MRRIKKEQVEDTLNPTITATTTQTHTPSGTQAKDNQL